MHSFDNSTRYAKKKDNWQQIQLILKALRSRDIPVELNVENIDDLIQNTNSATLAFVKKLYTQLAQKPLPELPKAAAKDKTIPPQWEGTFVLKDKELVKLSEQEEDFFKTEEVKAEVKEKKPEQTAKREETQTDQIKSIRLPKGPQKPIASGIQPETIAVLPSLYNLSIAFKGGCELEANKQECSTTQG
eukprot:TRINITY_DN488_c3_g1_i1.p5 TRINITY_DN488_c3_g1~~TRINITY_DN488_c3_g1_i1.p5  ORF type:complete len:189 (+),score=31.98 TRINITY_DN488_c3_g1_i1:290-856(+)